MDRSLWIATAAAAPRPTLVEDVETDIAIIGGGMLGITAAYLLKATGRQVTVLEAGRILEGVTGHTTGKLTSQHGIMYDRLVRDVGNDRARVHAQANEAAKDKVVSLVEGLEIDARLVRAPAYVYTQDRSEVDTFRKEARAAAELGLPASFTTDTGLPFPVEGAVRFDDQAHFHARKYLVALAQRIDGGGSAIYENTRVTDIKDGSPCVLQTENGTVRAQHVIVATNVPINDRAFFTPRMEPRRAYAVAFRAEERLQGMFINHGSPVRSLRSYEDDDGPLIIAAGENHHVGQHSDTGKHYDALQDFVRQHFRVGEVAYRWSTQDYYPLDGYPFIGKYAPNARNVWTATGFQGWGMTQTTAAAMVLEEMITKGSHPWAELYDPFSARRVIKDIVDPKFVKAQAQIVKKFITERVVQQKASHLQPGEGEVATIEGKSLAIHRDQGGILHARPAQCTHMGCFVAWNQAEQSWDCPCHGSRFSGAGEVLHGPATAALAEEKATEEDPAAR